MDHRRSLIVVLLGSAIAAAQDDPASVLIHTRDKLLAMSQRLRKYSCTETIDRSYFIRENPISVPRSCDQILGTRKREKPRLAGTDRLRLHVAIPGDAEILSWIGEPPMKIKIDELMETGPMTTGSLAALLPEIFGNAETRFSYIGLNEKIMEFGFHAPPEANGHLFRGGGKWRATGTDGSFWVDSEAEELRRLSVSTAELSEDTGVCQTEAVLEYHHVKIGGEDLLLPRENRTRFIERNGNESETAIAFSNCSDSQPTPVRARLNPVDPPPAGIVIPLALDSVVDTDLMAAGDPISATVAFDVVDPLTKAVVIPRGAIVRGRIVLLRHDLKEDRFLLGIAFETMEWHGGESLFYAKLQRPEAAISEKSWSNGVLVFPAHGGQWVVPAGMVSNWITGVPPK